MTMLKLIYVSLAFITALCLIACTQTENSGEENSSSTVETPSEERTAQVDEPGTADELITLMMKNLDTRLSLSNQNKTAIQSVYRNAYLEGGGSLDDLIERGKAKEVRQKIVKDTETEVLNILDEDQRTFYQKFSDNL